jgi:hypothetical protein
LTETGVSALLSPSPKDPLDGFGGFRSAAVSLLCDDLDLYVRTKSNETFQRKLSNMSRYLGPKVKLSRKVGVPIADTPKHTTKRQLVVPGVHGARGRRQKAYGIRKDEKQKVRFHYNVLERQFRRYLVEAGRRQGRDRHARGQQPHRRLRAAGGDPR